MTTAPFPAQLATWLLVAITPWLVVHVVLRIAEWQARAYGQPLMRPRGLRRLGIATSIAVPLVLSAGAGLEGWLPLPLVATGVAFVGLSAIALHVLGEIERATGPIRAVSASTREADLRPRRTAEYLALPWRVAPAVLVALGGAFLAFRLADPAPERRLMLPLTLALSAAVFGWLFATWRRQIARDPFIGVEGDTRDPRRPVTQLVYACELGLVTLFMTSAHLLLDLDWETSTGVGVAVTLTTAVAGIVGCAAALASGLVGRRYSLVQPGA